MKKWHGQVCAIEHIWPAIIASFGKKHLPDFCLCDLAHIITCHTSELYM